MSNVGNEESKVLGIPYVLIVFVVLNAAVVLIPVVLMQRAVISEIKKDLTPKVVVQKILVTPTATPTASPTPVKSTVVKPTITNTLKTATGSSLRK